MKRWRSLAFSIAIGACIAMLTPAKARAGSYPPAVTLEYSAVAGCPNDNTFKATVEERLGTKAFSDDAPTRVIVLITSHGQTFEGNMEWIDEKGNWVGDRTFPARNSDCADLVRAMAFTLALQLQLSAVDATAPSPTVPPSATSANTDRPIAAPPPTTPEKPVINELPHASPPEANSPNLGARPVAGIGVGGLAGFGMSSNAVPFSRVFGNLTWPVISLEFGVTAGGPTIVRRPDGAGFSRQDLLLNVAGCGMLSAFSACLVAKAGEIRIRGRDIDVPARGAGGVVETGLRVGAIQRIYGNSYVSAYAEGLVLPVLWSVTLDHNVVWTTPRFAETIGLDLSFRVE